MLSRDRKHPDGPEELQRRVEEKLDAMLAGVDVRRDVLWPHPLPPYPTDRLDDPDFYSYGDITMYYLMRLIEILAPVGVVVFVILWLLLVVDDSTMPAALAALIIGWFISWVTLRLMAISEDLGSLGEHNRQLYRRIEELEIKLSGEIHETARKERLRRHD